MQRFPPGGLKDGLRRGIAPTRFLSCTPPGNPSSARRGVLHSELGKVGTPVPNDFNKPLIKSRWKAYDPDGKFKETVTLSTEAKRRYEALGWTFSRAGRQDYQGRAQGHQT